MRLKKLFLSAVSVALFCCLALADGVMVVSWDGPRGQSTTVEGEGERTHKICANGIHAFLYQTEAGGVTKRTVALMAGGRGKGFRHLKNFTMSGWGYQGAWGIMPGGIWTHTTYDGDPLVYWEARGEMLPVPEWAPEKLAKPWSLPQIGPYETCWHPLGWFYGGQGIDPYWFDWRHCAEGYTRAFRELGATAMRNPIAFYLDRDGHPVWHSTPHFSLQSVAPPPGYSWDVDTAARWWPAVRDLAEYQPHDGQHFCRGYRAAIALRSVDPFAEDVAQMFLGRAKLAWAPDAARDDDPHWYWTARQIDQQLDETGKPGEYLGRQAAHVFRLVWEMEPESEFAALLETLVLKSVAAEPHIPYLTMTKPQHWQPAGPYVYGTPVAQCFEWQLMAVTMDLRPALADARAELLSYMGTNPLKIGAANGRFYGSNPPYMHLFFGDLAGKTAEEWMTIASVRHIPAGGSQPIDYWPRQYWEPLLD